MPKLIVPNVRCAFMAVHEKKAFKDGRPAYGGKLIIPPNHPIVAKLDEAMLQAANERWKEKGASILKFLIDENRVCFTKKPYRNGSGDVYEGFEGMFMLSMRHETIKPRVIGLDRQDLPPDSGKPYSGCYVNASVEIYAQDNDYGRRINCQPRGIQFFKDGPSFGGGSQAAPDEFEDLSNTGGDADDFL